MRASLDDDRVPKPDANANPCTAMRSFLRHAATPALLLSLAFAPSVQAANVPQKMVDVNAQACEQLAKTPGTEKFDPQRPADPAKIPAYCACVSKTYWASVPQADYEGMVEEMQRVATQPTVPPGGPHLTAVHAAQRERMSAAQSACH